MLESPVVFTVQLLNPYVATGHTKPLLVVHTYVILWLFYILFWDYDAN